MPLYQMKIDVQRDKVEELGYMTADLRTINNFSMGSLGNGYFFDFDEWKRSNGILIPRINEEGRIV